MMSLNNFRVAPPPETSGGGGSAHVATVASDTHGHTEQAGGPLQLLECLADFSRARPFELGHEDFDLVGGQVS
jgi:hypothetical protein